MKKIYELVIVNWKTTVKFAVPFAASLAAKYGYQLDESMVNEALVYIYGLLFLFSRDAAKN
jgi:hypothetical protein